MKNKFAITLAGTLILSTFGVAAASSNSISLLAQFSPATSGTWVHYNKREATPTQDGIREYWIRCGGGYQFYKPNDVTVVDKGTNYDTSQFDTNDPRYISYTTDSIFYDKSMTSYDYSESQNNYISEGYTFVDNNEKPINVNSLVTGEEQTIYAVKNNSKSIELKLLPVTEVIKTCTQLEKFYLARNISTDTISSGYYVLGNDIEFEYKTVETGNDNNWSSYLRNSTFDGRNRKIYNYLTKPGSTIESFFRIRLCNDKIKNIVFENAKVDSNFSSPLGIYVENTQYENIIFNNFEIDYSTSSLALTLFGGFYMNFGGTRTNETSFKNVVYNFSYAGKNAGEIQSIIGGSANSNDAAGNSRKYEVPDMEGCELNGVTTDIRGTMAQNDRTTKFWKTSGENGVRYKEVEGLTINARKSTQRSLVYSIKDSNYDYSEVSSLGIDNSWTIDSNYDPSTKTANTHSLVKLTKGNEVRYVDIVIASDTIYDKDQLYLINKSIHEGTIDSGSYIVVTCDITNTGSNISGSTGALFTFDGRGHTITVGGALWGYYGMFGTIKNNTIIKNTDFVLGGSAALSAAFAQSARMLNCSFKPFTTFNSAASSCFLSYSVSSLAIFSYVTFDFSGWTAESLGRDSMFVFVSYAVNGGSNTYNCLFSNVVIKGPSMFKFVSSYSSTTNSSWLDGADITYSEQ